VLDSKAPKIPLKDYVYNETRYSSLAQRDEERAEMLLKLAQEDVNSRWKMYERWRRRMEQGNREDNMET